MPTVRHKRGTRAALDALAGTNGLLAGQIYVITDEQRLAVALSASAYSALAKTSEIGGGGGGGDVVQITNLAEFEGWAATDSLTSGQLYWLSDIDIIAYAKTANDYFYVGGAAPDPLVLTSSSASAAPAGAVKLFRREIAGRQFPAFVGPSGLDSALQPLIARNKVGMWMPAGNATTVPGVFGFTAPTVTNFTATARNVATTNMFTRMRRLGYVTAATAGAVGHWRVAVYQYTTGDGAGLGGFNYIVRFGVSDAALVADARMFVGLRASATPANAEPSTLTNCIGVGHGAADTTLKLFYGGSAAQAPISLGVDFPSNTQSVDAYELALFSSPNEAATVHWEVTRLNTGHAAAGVISGGATVVPQATTLLAPWGYRTNNASALAVGLDVMGAYIETDQ